MTPPVDRGETAALPTLIPFTPENPKTRLGAVLSGRERSSFARTMLADVVSAVEAAGGDPVVLTTAELPSLSAVQRVDDRPLSRAVNAALDPPMAVVMADLALATAASVEDLFATTGDVVIAPGRGGGTNALVVRDSAFAVDYHGNSLGDHRTIAAAADLDCREVDSFRLATDIDEPADLVEVLLHGRGAAPAWLRSHGVQLRTSDGRVTVGRTAE